MGVGDVQVAENPPPVTVALPDAQVPGALLVWGKMTTAGRWAAGIAYIHTTWHSRALVTVWVPANLVTPWPAQQTADYRRVPRITLSGAPTTWPPLPPVYPAASAEWVKAHQHHLDYRRAPTK